VVANPLKAKNRDPYFYEADWTNTGRNEAYFHRHPGYSPVISYLFAGTPKTDPILGPAHHYVVRCPTPNTDRVSRAAIEFQKLVEFGTVPFEERFSMRRIACSDST